MSKRRAMGAGIKAAFARQAERASAGPSWAPLETPLAGAHVVPEDYLQELTAKVDGYVSKREAVAKLLAKTTTNSRSGARPDAAGTPDQLSEVAKWQGAAATCLQQLSMWPGSGIALQLQQQEALLHIMVNADLHTDGLLASRAYDLLLQNLTKHPPVWLSSPQGGSSSSSSQEQQPPVLQNAAMGGSCLVLFNHQHTPLLPNTPSPFQMLQQLVQNAVRLALSPCARSSSSSSAGGGGGGSGAATTAAGSVKQAVGAAGSQGQALLLLYVVQLLQADLLVRQAAFERYMALSETVEGEVVKEEARSRAAAALQNSLLHRVMLDDSVGGDSWRYLHESNKGKHQLVRDLLLLIACSPGTADATVSTLRPALSQQLAAAAATPAPDGDGDAVMQDAAAGTPGAVDAPAQCESAAAAQAAGVVADQVPLVSAVELVQSARVLLLLLLQLYSSCEEAGVYGRGGEGRHHMQRLQGGGGQPNDRFELDSALMTAIGHCGHSAVTYTLPQLEQRPNLQRLLLALPPVHRARLLSLMVLSVIHNRVVDPESEGKLAQSGHNLVLADLKEYLQDAGRGYCGFRQFSPLHIVEAVDARLEWAAKEMFGGQLLFAFLIGHLISSAAVTLRQGSASERQQFSEAAGRILDHVLLKNRDSLQLAAMAGQGEVLAVLSAAKQQLPL